MRVCAIPSPASGGLDPSRLAEDARTLLTRRAPVVTVPERLPEPGEDALEGRERVVEAVDGGDPAVTVEQPE